MTQHTRPCWWSCGIGWCLDEGLESEISAAPTGFDSWKMNNPGKFHPDPIGNDGALAQQQQQQDE